MGTELTALLYIEMLSFTDLLAMPKIRKFCMTAASIIQFQETSVLQNTMVCKLS